MPLTLLAAWTVRPAERPFRTWLCTANGSVGVHLPEGRFVVWNAAPGAAELAATVVPSGALVALDPRGACIAIASDSRLTLQSLAGEELHAVELAAGVVARGLEFRADGARLWVFGTVGGDFAAHAFDRALASDGRHSLTLSGGPYPTTINVHPTADAFVLTTNEDRHDPDAEIRRVGVRIDAGAPQVVFEVGDVGAPCAGFTADGSGLICADLFAGVALLAWPDYRFVVDAAPAEDHEGAFDALVVGDRVLTEQHPADTTMSSLRVLSLPSLAEVETIPWATRGSFATADDHAGIDLGSALGSDRFLEVSPSGDDTWALRVWQLT